MSALTTAESHRQQLAQLLERDPETLTDNASLLHELGLDSLAMMRVLTWLEERGVTIDIDRQPPATVGDLLALAQKATRAGVSIRVTQANGHDLGQLSATGIPVPSRPAVDPLMPVLQDQSLQLTPVTHDDVGFLYSLAARPETCFRWRYRGAPPSVERFTDDLWNLVLVQFVARRNSDGQPVGHVVAYSPEPAKRYVYIGAVFQPQQTGTGLAARAVAMFVRYLFHTFPLQKIYMEVPGYNWAQVSSGEGTLFRVEGILRGHNHYAGRAWDEYVCAIYPDGVSTT